LFSATKFITAAAILIPLIAIADQEPSSAANPYGISLSGYVDVGYSKMNSTGLYVGSTKALPLGSRALDAPDARQDKNVNTLALNQVGVVVSRQPKEGLGGMLHVIGGQDAKALAAWGAGDAGGYSYDNAHSLDLTLAYLTYAMNPVTLSAGKLQTLIGAESISNISNFNYSHSILYGPSQPATHTGIRLNYAPADSWGLSLGVHNGWDQVPDTSGKKTIELGFSANPSKMLSLIGSFNSGYELADGFKAPPSTVGKRQILDLIATISATDNLTLMFNYDSASQENALIAQGGRSTAKWDGLAAYANYQINDQWRTSLRGEYVNDPQGYTAGYVGVTGQTSREVNLTLAYAPVKAAEIRWEIRQDSSSQAVFLQTDGSGKDTQTSFGLEMIYKF